MKKQREFKPRQYRVMREGGIFHPQVKILFFWCNLNGAFRSKGEADKVIVLHNAKRAIAFNKNRGR